MTVYVCYPDIDDRTEFELFSTERAAISFFAELLKSGEMTTAELYYNGWIVPKILN